MNNQNAIVVLCLLLTYRLVFANESNFERGVIYFGGTYDAPNDATMASSEDCREVCTQDPRCIGWSWSIVGGACELKDCIDGKQTQKGFVSGRVRRSGRERFE